MRKYGLLLVLPLFVLNGCAEVCRPKYNPAQVLPCKVTGNRAVRLQVVDGRSPEERYFARSMFLKFYEPYVREYAQSPAFQLERPSAEILQESIEKAFVELGYVISSDADTQVNVELYKFLYTIWGRKRKVMADIEVDVSVKKRDSKILEKTMSRYDEKELDGLRQYQDGELLLNICLNNILKEIVCDAEIRNAILSK